MFFASRQNGSDPAEDAGIPAPAASPAIAEKLARQFLGVSLADLQKYGEAMGALLSELREALPAIRQQLERQQQQLSQIERQFNELSIARLTEIMAARRAAKSDD